MRAPASSIGISPIPDIADTSSPILRDVADGDAAGLIALVGACYADYPGCVLDVDGEAPWLRAMATWAAARDGRVWVAEQDSAVVGSIGVLPTRVRPQEADLPGRAPLELISLYVAHRARCRGLATRLIGRVEAEARRRGAAAVELWSDTRFRDAHRLYARLGYRRRPETRSLDDLSQTVEYGFIKTLDFNTLDSSTLDIKTQDEADR